MTFVFGINMPILEVMLVVFITGLTFMIWQMIIVNKHMKILERMTGQIRDYEEEEKGEVQRFEHDVKSLEGDEAELFLAKVVPTLAKMQNYVATQLLKGRDPEKIVDALVAKGVKKEHALKTLNAVGYFLNYYQKLPKKHTDAHEKVAAQLSPKVTVETQPTAKPTPAKK